MIDVQAVNPFALPCVDLCDRRKLPSHAAVYFAIAGEDVLYVGQTKGLQKRWLGHHQTEVLKGFHSVKLAWIEVDEEVLRLILERALIDRFKPLLNNGLRRVEIKAKVSTGGSVKNKIREFLEIQGITVYEFRKRTGIANKTAYDLCNKPEQYPSGEVMDKICKAFRIQPDVLLEWVED